MITNFFQGRQVYADFINDKEFIRNDTKMNRTIVDMAMLGLLGYATGVLASVFFKNKGFVRNLGLGFGAGYGFHYNTKELMDHCNCSKK